MYEVPIHKIEIKSVLRTYILIKWKEDKAVIFIHSILKLGKKIIHNGSYTNYHV